MAKYEDYAQKDAEDPIQSEIDEAAQQTEDRQAADNPPEFELPERFQGKSVEEVAQSFVELEKAYSRQGNDLGEMRRAVDEIIQQDLQSGSSTTTSSEEATEPVTIDDLYDDTEAAIERAVEKRLGTRVEQLEQELAQARLQSRVESLGDKFSDWQTTVQSQEFLEWVKESPYRQRLAQAADGYDMDAAEEILGLYSETSGLKDLRAEAQRDAQLRDATLEGTSAEVPATEQTFSKVDLLNKRIAKAHGDVEAEQWLRANAEAIAIAYEEGNLTD